MEHNERLEATSSNLGVVALVNLEQEWRPVLHVSNQVVLYNPTSHALSIRHKPPQPPQQPSCPYCKQKLPHDFEQESAIEDRLSSADASDPAYHSRASDYFRLLAVANETSSRPPTPPLRSPRRNSSSHGEGRRNTSAFPAEAMAEGYFKAFFQEEYKLGMGANGSVFLCQHLLDRNPLGHFAVKKIAVGESHSYLLNILREVRLLERLHHPNIITYHHAWLESCQFSAFGPKVPTLHVLMQWAEGGSLDDLIDARLGRATKHIFMDPLSPFVATADLAGTTLASTRPPSEGITPTTANGDRAARPLFTHQGSSYDIHSRSARIKAFRAMQKASPSERERLRREMEEVRVRGAKKWPSWKAVHLLSAEEVKSLFKDVVEGLGFLHDRSILHLDLKPGNVLLTWDEGSLIPRAMLSDFGTSRDRLSSSRIRSGNTGTLEYASPESLPAPLTRTLGQVDSKADMWSLGMILHKLLFFKLPYNYAADGDANGERDSGIDEPEKLDKLEKEVLDYPGFKATPALATTFEARRLPTSFLVLLEGLLNVVPSARPSCERVSAAIRSGKFDPLEEHRSRAGSSLVPLRTISDPTPADANAGQTSPDLASPSHGVAESGQQTDAVMHGSSSLVRHNNEELSPVPVHALPPSLPSSAVQHITERVPASGSPILTLPPPTSDDGVNLQGVESKSSAAIEIWSGLWDKVSAQRLTGQGRRGRSVWELRYPDWRDGAFWSRTLKSCILVVKVMTISRLCSTSEPRSYLMALLTLVAISDTWFKELWISAVLLILHIGVIWYWCLVM